jgi:hypothetical protein
MEDKRKVDRRFLLYYVRVYAAATRQQISYLLDITRRGIMLVGDHSLPEGLTTHLRVEGTEEVADKLFMEFSAHSMWCEPGISPNMANNGF